VTHKSVFYVKFPSPLRAFWARKRNRRRLLDHWE